MSKLKQNKKLLAVLITMGVLILLGGTYALYRLVLFDDLNVNVATKGLDYYLNYDKGSDFTGGLELCDDYTEGNSLSVTLYKKNNKYANIYGHIYLKVNSIGENLREEYALKYTVEDSNGEISTGTLRGVNEGETVLLAHNIELGTNEENYNVYIWLDRSEGAHSSISGESFSANLVVEASQKPIDAEDFDGNEILHYEDMTPSQKIEHDLELTAEWFIGQRTKELNGEETEEVYDEWIERVGGSFPSCPSSSEEDIWNCFNNNAPYDNYDIYTIGGDIFNKIGLGDKGINFNSFHTTAFINEENNKLCVTFKLMRQFNYYYGDAGADDEFNHYSFSTSDGYPLIFKSSGCQ